MSTEEGNKIIAVFMGAEMIAPIGYTMRGVKFPKETHGLWVHAATDLRYHESWDWLMPVVEKIVHAACELPTIELRKEARKKYDLIQDQLCNFIISGVHFYSVQFITWYNAQSPKK